MTFFQALKQSLSPEKTPYDILGVSPFDSSEKIKQAYYKLVMLHHPDRVGENARIVEINAAYASLRKMNRV